MVVSAAFLAMFGALLTWGFRLRGPRGRALISAYNVILGLFFLYLLLPGLLLILFNQGQYVWLPEIGSGEVVAVTLMVCMLACVAFICGYLVRIKRRAITQFDGQRGSTMAEFVVAWTLVFVGVALKVYIAHSSGDMEINLQRYSGGIRENLGIDAVSSTLVALQYLSGVADAGATWLLLERMRSRRNLILATVVFAAVVTATYFGSAKRLFLLWPVLTAGLGVHYYVKPILLSRLPAFGAVILGIGFLSLMFRIYVPAYVTGIEIDLNDVDWAQGSLLKFYFFSLEFAMFEFLSLALYESSQVITLFGSTVEAFIETNIVPFAYFIPRTLWPDKPTFFLDLSHAYRVVAMGGALDGRGGGVATTLLGTSWTIGGAVGLLVAMICLGFVCRFLDSNPKLRGTLRIADICWYSFGLVTVFHLFRQGTIAWTAIIVVVQQSGLVLGYMALSLASGSVRRRTAYNQLVPDSRHRRDS